MTKDELRSQLLALDCEIASGPWNEEHMYGAVRHVTRNVDSSAYCNDCPDEEDGREEHKFFSIYDGTNLAKLRNLLPEILKALKS